MAHDEKLGRQKTDMLVTNPARPDSATTRGMSVGLRNEAQHLPQRKIRSFDVSQSISTVSLDMVAATGSAAGPFAQELLSRVAKRVAGLLELACVACARAAALPCIDES